MLTDTDKDRIRAELTRAQNLPTEQYIGYLADWSNDQYEHSGHYADPVAAQTAMGAYARQILPGIVADHQAADAILAAVDGAE